MTGRSFTQTGGAWIGTLYATWPFARLSATADDLRLSCLGHHYTIPRGSIKSLSRHRGIISTGLRIRHNNASLPDSILFWASLFFWTPGFRKLKAGLERLGYAIDTEDV